MACSCETDTPASCLTLSLGADSMTDLGRDGARLRPLGCACAALAREDDVGFGGKAGFDDSCSCISRNWRWISAARLSELEASIRIERAAARLEGEVLNIDDTLVEAVFGGLIPEEFEEKEDEEAD